jgi:hypothetical protein
MAYCVDGETVEETVQKIIRISDALELQGEPTEIPYGKIWSIKVIS